MESTRVHPSSSVQKTAAGDESVNSLMHINKMMQQLHDACLPFMSLQVENNGAFQLVSKIKVTVQQMLQAISQYLPPLDVKSKKHYNSDDDDDAPSKKLKKKNSPLLLHPIDSPSSSNEKDREESRKVSTILKRPTELKFLPTEEELVENLYAMKASSYPFSSETRNYAYWPINDCVNFYSTEPRNLPGADILNGKNGQQLFFYVITEKKKNENGFRINRDAGHGSWRCTSGDFEIPKGTGSPKGFRKKFNYYEKDEKKSTDWIMYEYRLNTPKSEKFQPYWTICKISRSGKSHGSSSNTTKKTAATATRDQVEDEGQQLLKEANSFNLSQLLPFQQLTVIEGLIGPSSEISQSYDSSTIDGTSGEGGNVTSKPEFERSSQETSCYVQEAIRCNPFYPDSPGFLESII